MEDNTMPLSQAKIQFGSRFGTRIFLVSLVGNGPPWWVVTQDSGPSDLLLCQRLNDYANMRHFNESDDYIPHLAYDMAERMAKHLRGKVIWWNVSEGGDLPDYSGAVL